MKLIFARQGVYFQLHVDCHPNNLNAPMYVDQFLLNKTAAAFSFGKSMFVCKFL